MTGRSDDLRRLRSWSDRSAHGRLAPFDLSELVLVLYPFTTPTDDEVAWHHVAAAAGLDLRSFLQTSPGDPEVFYDASQPQMALEPPAEGVVPIPVRRAIKEALGDIASDRITVGLYAGYGRCPQGLPIDPDPVEVGMVDYWFANVAAAEFFDAWVRDDVTADAAPWTGLVTFAWPSDRRWFVCADPDLCYSEVYADAATLARLEGSPVETCRITLPAAFLTGADSE